MRARPVIPNATTMITRRVRQRMFLLRPSEETNNIIGYVVGVAADKYGIRMHAMKVLSNHWHGVSTDPHGNAVRFRQDCHSLIGRALNRLHDDEENLWNSSQTAVTECDEPDDVIGRIAYTMANSVEGGLVRYAHRWPGVKHMWPHKPRTYKRPKCFFGTSMPEEVTLEMHRPPGFDHLSDEELAEHVESAVHEREEFFRAEADREGRPFLGRAAILAQDRYGRPTTKGKPRKPHARRFAACSLERVAELVRQRRQWEAGYAEAMALWKTGKRDVVFPHGTYKMRVVHNARCAGPPGS